MPYRQLLPLLTFIAAAHAAPARSPGATTASSPTTKRQPLTAKGYITNCHSYTVYRVSGVAAGQVSNGQMREYLNTYYVGYPLDSGKTWGPKKAYKPSRGDIIAIYAKGSTDPMHSGMISDGSDELHVDHMRVQNVFARWEKGNPDGMPVGQIQLSDGYPKKKSGFYRVPVSGDPRTVGRDIRKATQQIIAELKKLKPKLDPQKITDSITLLHRLGQPLRELREEDQIRVVYDKQKGKKVPRKFRPWSATRTIAVAWKRPSVPDVVGMPLADAEKKIREQKLDVRRRKFPGPPKKGQLGMVASAKPKEGTRLRVGDSVTVTYYTKQQYKATCHSAVLGDRRRASFYVKIEGLSDCMRILRFEAGGLKSHATQEYEGTPIVFQVWPLEKLPKTAAVIIPDPDGDIRLPIKHLGKTKTEPRRKLDAKSIKQLGASLKKLRKLLKKENRRGTRYKSEAAVLAGLAQQHRAIAHRYSLFDEGKYEQNMVKCIDYMRRARASSKRRPDKGIASAYGEILLHACYAQDIDMARRYYKAWQAEIATVLGYPKNASQVKEVRGIYRALSKLARTVGGKHEPARVFWEAGEDLAAKTLGSKYKREPYSYTVGGRARLTAAR